MSTLIHSFTPPVIPGLRELYELNSPVLGKLNASVNPDEAGSVLINVIYNPDCLETICAIVQFKEELVAYSNELGVDKVNIPTIDFISIRDIYNNKVADIYVWIGLESTLTITRPDKRKALSKKEHHVVYNDMSISSKQMTAFDERIGEIMEILPNSIRYGVYLRALSTLICLSGIGDRYSQFEQGHKRTGKFIDTQAVLSKFYTQQATKEEVYEAFHLGEKAESVLSGEPVFSIIDAKERYKLAESKVRKSINIQGTVDRVVVDYNSRTVFITHIDQKYWLARRFISMSWERYCNITLARSGAITTSNIPDTKPLMIREGFPGSV